MTTSTAAQQLVVNATSDETKDVLTLALFGVLVAGIVLGTAGWSAYVTYTRPKDVRRVEALQRALDSVRLLENVRLQTVLLVTIPTPWRSWASMKPHVWENCGSLAALAMMAVGVIMLMAGSLREVSPDALNLRSAGLMVATIASSLYVIFRQIIYYQEKRRAGGATAVDAGYLPPSTVEPDQEVPVSAMARASHQPFVTTAMARHAALGSRPVTTNRPTTTPGTMGPRSASVSSLGTSTLPAAPSTNHSSSRLNPTSSSSRLASYARAASRTPPPPASVTVDAVQGGTAVANFYTFDWHFRNLMQILIILVEFVQLISFPLRDLFNNPALNGEGASATQDLVRILDNMMRVLTLIPDQLSALLLYQLQFWTFFGVIMAGAAVAATFAIAKYRFGRHWPVGWVFALVPVASLLYLPFLVTFVSSAACIAQTFKSQALRCNNQRAHETLYLVCSMVGFIVAYALLTVFLSADERRPTEGDITFKSSSVAFMKNMGFLMVIISLLVPAQKPVVRGLLSLIIIVTMCAYNIRQRPCYVYQINYLRTATLSMIIWTTLLVTLLNDAAVVITLGPKTIVATFATGYTVLAAGLFAGFKLHMATRRLKLCIMTRASSRPPSHARHAEPTLAGRARSMADLTTVPPVPPLPADAAAAGQSIELDKDRAGSGARTLSSAMAPGPAGTTPGGMTGSRKRSLPVVVATAAGTAGRVGGGADTGGVVTAGVGNDLKRNGSEVVLALEP
ncbi:hypothetical protein GGF31_001073 [Allomyces arbusculus]|nr:hypothetical protein GGF31_001073 [Allomyces arbusculus]